MEYMIETGLVEGWRYLLSRGKPGSGSEATNGAEDRNFLNWVFDPQRHSWDCGLACVRMVLRWRYLLEQHTNDPLKETDVRAAYFSFISRLDTFTNSYTDAINKAELEAAQFDSPTFCSPTLATLAEHSSRVGISKGKNGILGLTPASSRGRPSSNNSSVIARRSNSSPLWSIDLLKLLRDAGVDASLHTSCMGVSDSNLSIPWYQETSTQHDVSRVRGLFALAQAEGWAVLNSNTGTGTGSDANSSDREEASTPRAREEDGEGAVLPQQQEIWSSKEKEEEREKEKEKERQRPAFLSLEESSGSSSGSLASVGSKQSNPYTIDSAATTRDASSERSDSRQESPMDGLFAGEPEPEGSGDAWSESACSIRAALGRGEICIVLVDTTKLPGVGSSSSSSSSSSRRGRKTSTVSDYMRYPAAAAFAAAAAAAASGVDGTSYPAAAYPAAALVTAAAFRLAASAAQQSSGYFAMSSAAAAAAAAAKATSNFSSRHLVDSLTDSLGEGGEGKPDEGALALNGVDGLDGGTDAKASDCGRDVHSESAADDDESEPDADADGQPDDQGFVGHYILVIGFCQGSGCIRGPFGLNLEPVPPYFMFLDPEPLSGGLVKVVPARVLYDARMSPGTDQDAIFCSLPSLSQTSAPAAN
jgi:hypothetical protein